MIYCIFSPDAPIEPPLPGGGLGFPSGGVAPGGPGSVPDDDPGAPGTCVEFTVHDMKK